MINKSAQETFIQESIHQAVMPTEVISGLQANRAGRYLDCTLGGAGHSRLILNANLDNTLVSCDRDPIAIGRAKSWSCSEPRVEIVQANFSEIAVLFRNQKFDGILADLGISSDQLLPGRGFSFKDDLSLDMRMNPDLGQTAADLINSSSQQEIANFLKAGGVDQGAWKIAEAIVKSRPFSNAIDLANVINSAVKISPSKKINPATIAFQAIRIQVNDELREIQELLRIIPEVAASGCRVVIISFHSLEDRYVARAMRDWANPPRKPVLWGGAVDEGLFAKGRLISKKAIMPSSEEIQNNPRARSAKMRNFIFN